MTRVEMREFRCAGQGCPDRDLCYRFRQAAPGESSPMTALWVRLEVGQRRCDQFIERTSEVGR
jgi:hypothetical protein